jgi:hypothetical protein
MINVNKFYILPTQFVYAFCVDLKTNCDYLPIQNYLISLLCGDKCVCCAVRTETLCIIQVNFSLY